MARKKKYGSGLITGLLLPMGLICVFAFCSLALALMGGQAYRQIQAGVDDSFGSTVAASYLRTKLAQNNRLDSVFIREQDGIDVLVIRSSRAEKDFETRIFVVDGRLMESFVSADASFSVTGAVTIAEVSRCDFAISSQGLFTAEIESRQGTHIRTAFALVQGGDE